MNLFAKILSIGIGAVVGAWLLPGVYLHGLGTTLLLAIILIILNATVKPFLQIITIPLTIVTFGLFLLIINGIVIMICDALLGGFEVRTIWWGILFSIILSGISSLFYNEKKHSRNK